MIDKLSLPTAASWRSVGPGIGVVVLVFLRDNVFNLQKKNKDDNNKLVNSEKRTLKHAMNEYREALSKLTDAELEEKIEAKEVLESGKTFSCQNYSCCV